MKKMTRRQALAATIVAPVAVAAGCKLPEAEAKTLWVPKETGRWSSANPPTTQLAPQPQPRDWYGMNMHILQIIQPDDWRRLSAEEQQALSVGYASELAYWRRRFGSRYSSRGFDDGVRWEGARKRMHDHLDLIAEQTPQLRNALEFPLHRLLEYGRLYTATGGYWTSSVSSVGYTAEFSIRQFAYGWESEYGKDGLGSWTPNAPTICGATTLAVTIMARKRSRLERRVFIISHTPGKLDALRYLSEYATGPEFPKALQSTVQGAMTAVASMPAETYWPYWITSLSLQRQRDLHDTRKIGPYEMFMA